MLMKMAEGSNINVNECVFEFSPSKRDNGNSLVNLKSSNFIFQSSNCCIKINFGWENNDERKIKIYVESQPTLSPNFYVTVFVSAGENSARYPKEKILDLNRFIWCCSLGELRRQLPDIDKKNMKFRFIFQKHLDCNPDQKSSGHKLVQTCSSESNSLERFSDDFSRLLKNDTMYDVQLKFGDKVIKAHKAVLRARSKYFENKLQSATGDQLKIQFVDPAAFYEIVRYIYTGKCPEFSFELAKNIYKSGDLSDTGCLREQCIQFLTDSLTIDNACECLAFSADDYFKERVVAYIIIKEIPFLEEYWKPFCDQHPQSAIDLLNRLCRIMRRQRSIEGTEY